MSNKKTMRCVACGKGTVRPLAKAGRRMRYKTMMVEVPGELAIPTCDACGEEWFDETTAEEVDDALGAAYRRLLHRKFTEALADLTPTISQRQLEALLGLSQGDLSHLRSGQYDPSPHLVADLALLARDPARRVHDLQEFWEEKKAG